MSHVTRLLDQLKTAVKEYRMADVTRIENAILAFIWRGAQPLGDDAQKIVKVLRGHRRFRALERAASALRATGTSDALVEHSLLQAVIDLGDFEVADALLARAHRERPGDAEFEGSRGRLAKQRYVAALQNGAKPDDPEARELLKRAFAHYAGLYAQDRAMYWHGINALALAARAARDGIKLGKAFNVKEVAKEILAVVGACSGKDCTWQKATALECEVALGRTEQMIVRAAAYVADESCDAFAYASTLRQLREIWMLDESDPNLRLVTGLLEAKIIGNHERVVPPADVPKPPEAAAARDRIGEAWSHTRGANGGRARAPEHDGLEKAFGGSLFTYANYRRGLDCADAVGWLGRRRERPSGSGFLVSGSLLSSEWKGNVFVTNAHVLDKNPASNAALSPDDAVVGFESGPNQGKTFKVQGQILWRSPIEKLDTVVLRLERSPTKAALNEIITEHPRLHDDAYVYIIGYPSGGPLHYSMNDNRLLDHDKRVLHYRTRTEPGSSGSPVFDHLWQLTAVHHAGRDHMPCLNGKGGTYEANEGISILAIKDAIRRSRK